MSDRFADDRRKRDRRAYRDPHYAGPERRIAKRRHAEREPRSKLGLVIGAVALLLVADATLWGGEYRRAVIASVSAELTQTRDWSAHVWDMG